jgi:hypothetical protein
MIFMREIQPSTQRSTGWSTISNRHFVAVAILAATIGILAAIEGTASVRGPADTDQLAFFFPAAQKALNGDPFSIYAVRYIGYPNYNPPLSTLLMAPLLGLAQGIGLPGANSCVSQGYIGESCRSLLGFVGICFVPFVLLLGTAALAALRKAYPQISQGQALLAYGLIVLSPLTWLNFTIWWHFEQPMMLFFFVAGIWLLQSQRPYLAGVLLGLAVLTRTTALIPLIALLVILTVERAWPILIKLAGVIAAVVIIGFGPFFAFDYADTSYSLLQWRGTAPSGNTIWAIFRKTPLNSIAIRLDMPTVILATAIIAYLAVRYFGVSAFRREIYAVLAIAALFTPMLSKTSWPYYYAEPLIFIIIWEFSTLHEAPVGIWRWPIISLVYLSITTTLAEFMGNASTTPIVSILMGLVEFASMGAVAYAIWQRYRELTAVAPTSATAQPPISGNLVEPDMRRGW